MEHIQNAHPPAGLDADRLEPERSSDSLTPMIGEIVPSTRHDGWTAERIRTFLLALAESGVVEDAAKAAGMTRQGAYRYHSRASGRAFHLAWEAALRLASRRLADAAMARALEGHVETIRRDGIVVAERHRFDNRLTMQVLARLDERAARSEDEEEKVIGCVAEEFEQFVDIVCRGEGAGDFILARRRKRGRDGTMEPRLLRRLDNYDRYGVGHPSEIEVSDIDRERPESWSKDQAERAKRAELLKPGLEAQARKTTTDDNTITEIVRRIVCPDGTETIIPPRR